MPAFDGSNIFGAAVKMSRTLLPRDEQINSYAGLNGQESLDMGHRGRSTNVTGWLYGPDRPTLAATVVAFESYHDGNAYVLTDTDGIDWAYVKLVEFQCDPKIVYDAYYFLMRRYSARFHHLV